MDKSYIYEEFIDVDNGLSAFQIGVDSRMSDNYLSGRHQSVYGRAGLQPRRDQKVAGGGWGRAPQYRRKGDPLHHSLVRRGEKLGCENMPRLWAEGLRVRSAPMWERGKELGH